MHRSDPDIALPTPALPTRFVHVFLYVAFWTMLGLFNVGQSFLIRASSGRDFDLKNALILGLSDWYLWALIVPGIVWLCRHFPLGADRWPTSLPVHIGVNLLCSFVIQLIMVPIWQNYGPPPVERDFFSILHLHLTSELVFYFWVYWGVVGVAHALDYYRMYRERELRASQLETRLAVTQLQMLKMQLQPHFLFNTLNAISALMHRDVDVADRMLARLGELLRTTLENVGTQEVSLRQELDFIRPYLEIEQVRLGPRLTVRLEAAPDTLGAYVPNLLLQPLVENAVRHAIAPHSRPGCITVRARREGETLRLEVCDDGPGLPARRREGVGLANTRARLQQLYGPAHRFEVTNAPGSGVLVSMLLPFREEAGEVLGFEPRPLEGDVTPPSDWHDK